MINAKEVVEVLCKENGDELEEKILWDVPPHNGYYETVITIMHDREKHLRPSENAGEHMPKIIVFKERYCHKDKDESMRVAYLALLINLYRFATRSAYDDLLNIYKKHSLV